MKQKWIISIIVMLCISFLSLENSYAYNGKTAAQYARTYAMTPNKAFYNFDNKDCTNFVSQCVMAGGYSMKLDSGFHKKPILTKKYICNNTDSYWYMKTVKRKIGFDYWEYSHAWSTVSGFYYFNRHYVGTALIKRYDPNNKKSMENLKQNARVGDVLQVNGSKEQHSIIITKKENNTLYYSQHSEARQDREISKFIAFAKKSDANPEIIRIQY